MNTYGGVMAVLCVVIGAGAYRYGKARRDAGRPVTQADMLRAGLVAEGIAWMVLLPYLSAAKTPAHSILFLILALLALHVAAFAILWLSMTLVRLASGAARGKPKLPMPHPLD